MSVTSTDTVIADRSYLLNSSISSLSSPRRKKSQISKTYKQASDFFLTRRFTEALSTLEPILTPPKVSEEGDDDVRHEDGDGNEHEEKLAPIADASRSSRIKVWSLYLTLLNAIIELGPGEGKEAFGTKQWRSIAAKAQDGSIWDEVVRLGYRGVEGNVDADVVANLATLLLAQSPSQTKNQQFLETYLAAAGLPSIANLTDLSTSLNGDSEHTNGDARVSHRENGTNTPRELASRIKILELYALHVLPANKEWDYAREFIRMSEILDEEGRETFLQTLDELQNEQTGGHSHKQDLTSRQEEQQKEINELQQSSDTKPEHTSNNHANHSPKHRRSNSEHDYGIEDAKPNPSQEPNPPKASTPKPSSQSDRPSAQKPNRSTPKMIPRKPAKAGIYHHGVAFVAGMQKLILNMSHSFSQNPMAILRFVLFLVALLMALSRKDIKDRIQGLMGKGWEKVRRTVRMGVKVSYI